jgi:hypothetical protein
MLEKNTRRQSNRVLTIASVWIHWKLLAIRGQRLERQESFIDH